MEVKINIPKDVQYIIDKIHSNGFEAFIVGGCVRDSILERTPNDWDITTSAKPEDVQMIFKKVIPTGIKHGTVTVMVNNEGYEVTTYRIDGDYSDSRRPDKVEFTDDIVKDLSRRDFTINAMAYNHKEGLIDPFNGLNDIINKSIQTVGKPDDRFKEDYLRMLRAIRFEYQLGFELEPYVYYSIEENSHLLKGIAKERIQLELNKMLLCNNPYVINRLQGVGVLDEIHLELNKLCCVSQNNPHHINDLWFHTINVIGNIDNRIHLKLAALLHDIGKKETKTTDKNGIEHFYRHDEKSVEIAERILKDLRYDNKTIDIVLTLVKFHDRPVEPTLKSVKRFLNKIGNYDTFKDWTELRWADISAQNPKYLKDKARNLSSIEIIAEEIVRQQQPFSIKDLDINGHDLISMGYKGKSIRDVLDRLLEDVIECPELNHKDCLIEKSKEYKTIK